MTPTVGSTRCTQHACSVSMPSACLRKHATLVVCMAGSNGRQYGIKAGALQPDVSIEGSCTGTWNGAYLCRGTDNYIKWARPDLGTADFVIESKFKAPKLNATALSFVLWSGSTMMHIGLDAVDNSMFCWGGPWDGISTLRSTPLRPGNFQIISLVRKSGRLKVYVDGTEASLPHRDGTEIEGLPLSEPISAVGWRPWRNSIKVRELSEVTTGGGPPVLALRCCPCCDVAAAAHDDANDDTDNLEDDDDNVDDDDDGDDGDNDDDDDDRHPPPPLPLPPTITQMSSSFWCSSDHFPAILLLHSCRFIQ